MRAIRMFIPLAAAILSAQPAVAARPVHPLEFFEGRTESSGTVKTFMKKPYRTRSLGRGRIEPDGSLSLFQRVEDEGKPPRERRWRIREIVAGHFAGTMSEASGPVTIDEVGGRYRFRFKMKGSLAVEQWVVPLAGGLSARNLMTVRKFGMVVGTGEGVIRKLTDR